MIEHPPLYFARHGQTDWNLEGRIQGWVDTELNETGKAQAAALARAFIQIPRLAQDFDFHVSPMRRARQTMDAIAGALGVPEEAIKVDPLLQELGFGIWEGEMFNTLKASPVYPRKSDARYPWRPEGGESYEDGTARVTEWLSKITQPTLLVAHGAVGRCLIGKLTGLSPGATVKLLMPQGCYCRIEKGRAEWFDAMAAAA